MKTSHLLGALCASASTFVASPSIAGAFSWTPNLTEQSRMKAVLRALLICVSVSVMGNAHAYFVRPFIQIGTSPIIDGFVANGNTQGSLTFAADAHTEVDLAAGTVKSSADATGSNQVVQAGGSFGDTLTFQNAVGTTAGISFDFDGVIDVINFNFIGSSLSTFVNVNLAVFDTGVANYLNFNTLGGAHIQESIFVDYGSGETTDFTKIINDALSGSLTIGATSTFDVFASISLAAITNANSSTISMDFLNTGAFGIATAPGVTFTSQSGVFLTAIPIPAAVWLFGSGLLGLIGVARRKKVA